MTNKEAIEILKREKPIHDTRKCGIELCEAVDMAIEALEKQLPEKVKIANDYEELLCPCCGVDLMGSLSEPDHDPYYCFECGQAIDWSDELEEDDD